MKKHPEWKKYKRIFDQVVYDILDGNLEHKQADWHCGTAHCVCGWFEIKTLFKEEFYDSEEQLFIRGNSSFMASKLFNEVEETLKLDCYNVSEIKANIVSYLTGYSFKSLANLFSSINSKEYIRILATRMGISVPPLEKVVVNENDYQNVKNNTPVVVSVPNIS